MKKPSPKARPGNRNAAKDDESRVPVTMRLPKDVREKISNQADAEGNKLSQADVVTKLAREHL